MISIVWILIKLMFAFGLIGAILILGIYGIYIGLIKLYSKLSKKEIKEIDEKAKKMFEKVVGQIVNSNEIQSFALLQNQEFKNKLEKEIEKLSSLSIESTKMQEVSYLGFRIFEIEFLGSEVNQGYFKVGIKRCIELVRAYPEIYTKQVKVDNQENHVLFTFCYALNEKQRKALAEFVREQQDNRRKLELEKQMESFVDYDLEKEYQQYGL